jgi:hypothetical protein
MAGKRGKEAGGKSGGKRDAAKAKVGGGQETGKSVPEEVGAAESDQEFLSRMARIQREAAETAAAESGKYVREGEEARAKGKEVGEKLKVIEECREIAKEFERDPPLLFRSHINGKFVEEHYAGEYGEKVDKLKKNNFSFRSAVDDTSTFTTQFKAFGNAYVRRGAQRIPLPPDSEKMPLMVKDGDIIGAEADSYVYGICDYEGNDDNNHTNVFIFPGSELRLSLEEKKTTPAPAYMDPGAVPDAVKRKSKSTVFTYKIRGIELLKGIFQVQLTRKGKDVNNMLKVPGECPGFEFKPASELMNKMLDKEIGKMGAYSVEMGRVFAGKINPHRFRRGGPCEEINSFIELCGNGRIVIAGTMNMVASGGKETGKILGPAKITVDMGSIYETDCNKIPDLRVAAIIKRPYLVQMYIGMLNGKKELEEYFEKRESGKGAEPAPSGAEEMLAYAEGIGDKDLILMAREQMKTEENFKRMLGGKDLAGAEEERIRKTLEFCKAQIRELRPQVEGPLPPYNSINAGDRL